MAESLGNPNMAPGLDTADDPTAGGPPMKRDRDAEDDDDDDDRKTGRERRKIEIKFIADKSRRHITFSKRKAGIMKKAYELSVLTGTQVLLLVVSETGLVYTFTTPKLQPLVTKPEGKNLIQACLNAPEEGSPPGQQDEEEEEEGSPPPPPPQQQQQPQAPPPQQQQQGPPQQPPPMQQQQQPQQGNSMYMSAEHAAAYNNYLGGQGQGQGQNRPPPGGQYPPPHMQ